MRGISFFASRTVRARRGQEVLCGDGALRSHRRGAGQAAVVVSRTGYASNPEVAALSVARRTERPVSMDSPAGPFTVARASGGAHQPPP
jgi:hypothetical protein